MRSLIKIGLKKKMAVCFNERSKKVVIVILSQKYEVHKTSKANNS